MTIERYADKHYEDILTLVNNFYEEALKSYDTGIDLATIQSAIQKLKDDAFLLIVDGKCEGVLAGIVTQTPLNPKPVYQEVIWYVNEPFRRYGVAMLKEAQRILKDRGFGSIVMVCLHNSKTEKLFNFYQRIGFIPMETHFIRSL